MSIHKLLYLGHFFSQLFIVNVVLHSRTVEALRRDWLLFTITYSNHGLVPTKISELLIACEKLSPRCSDKTVMAVPNATLNPRGEKHFSQGNKTLEVASRHNIDIMLQLILEALIIFFLLYLCFSLVVCFVDIGNLWLAASCNFSCVDQVLVYLGCSLKKIVL